MSNNNGFSPEVRRLAISGFLNELETITEGFEIAKQLIIHKLISYKEAGKGLEMLSPEQLAQMLDGIENWEIYEWWAIAFQLMQSGILSSSDVQGIYIYMQQEELLRDKKLTADLRKNMDLLDRQSLGVKTKIKTILDME